MATNTSSVSATFAFQTVAGATRAANGVTFAIGDIDELVIPLLGINGYRDVVTITAVDGDGNAMTAAQVAAAITVTKGSVAGDAPTGLNPFTGQADLITNSNATVVVRFNCLIQSFTVSFTSAVNGTTEQWIAISDIFWCSA